MVSRRVVLLCGPAGAGKTTAARESDLEVFDRDDEKWGSESQFKAAIHGLAFDPNAQAVVIRSCPTSKSRTEVAAAIGATHTLLLLEDQRVLRDRIARRNRADKANGLASLRVWFARFDHADRAPLFTSWAALTEHVGVTSQEW